MGKAAADRQNWVTPVSLTLTDKVKNAICLHYMAKECLSTGKPLVNQEAKLKPSYFQHSFIILK